ncbi:hypothetical protein FKM82_025746 [Ascaphus truei]
MGHSPPSVGLRSTWSDLIGVSCCLVEAIASHSVRSKGLRFLFGLFFLQVSVKEGFYKPDYLGGTWHPSGFWGTGLSPTLPFFNLPFLFSNFCHYR